MRVGGLSIPVDLLPLGMAESDRGHEESEPHLSRAEARVVYEAMPHRRQRTTVEPKLTRSRLWRQYSVCTDRPQVPTLEHAERGSGQELA
jgi:hypothetical protein